MKQIIVASQNPVKLQAVMMGFEQFFSDEEFSVQGVAVPSGWMTSLLRMKRPCRGRSTAWSRHNRKRSGGLLGGD